MKRIAVVMAVYRPHLPWLREQLLSLNAQDYPSLRLYVRDDADPEAVYRQICACVGECVTAFPVETARNERNLGSNATFSRLTEAAEGDYIAYCDQDDVWEPTKLSALAQALERENAALACCDVSIIDPNGARVADSIRKIKPHIVYRSGERLAPALLTYNFVTGCATLARMDVAKAALPFLQTWVYDQWLGIFAAAQGRVTCVERPLVRHRVHQSNQTSTLANVTSKQSYYQLRVRPYERRMAELGKRVDLGEPQRRAEAWASARAALANRQSGAWRKLCALRAVNPQITLFELLLPVLPNALVSILLRMIRRGIL